MTNPPISSTSDQWVIGTQGLTKRFKHVTAVDGLDLSIWRGEIFALLGERVADDAIPPEEIKAFCEKLRERFAEPAR